MPDWGEAWARNSKIDQFKVRPFDVAALNITLMTLGGLRFSSSTTACRAPYLRKCLRRRVCLSTCPLTSHISARRCRTCGSCGSITTSCDGQAMVAACVSAALCSLVGTIPPSLGESNSIISMGATSAVTACELSELTLTTRYLTQICGTTHGCAAHSRPRSTSIGIGSGITARTWTRVGMASVTRLHPRTARAASWSHRERRWVDRARRIRLGRAVLSFRSASHFFSFSLLTRNLF